MFLFIMFWRSFIDVIILFKYIPCFYLSLQKNQKKRSWKYSNTSHVFIYPLIGSRSIARKLIQIHPMFLFIDRIRKQERERILFKYIPCFYLSTAVGAIRYQRTSFKYIPCFYLSTTDLCAAKILMNSNTSHVFIYLVHRCLARQHG